MRRLTVISDCSATTGMLLEIVLQWQERDPLLQTEILSVDGVAAPEGVVAGSALSHADGAAWRIRDWLALPRFHNVSTGNVHNCKGSDLPWALEELTRYTDIVLAPRSLLVHPELNWYQHLQPHVHSPMLLPFAAAAAHPNRVLLFPDPQVTRSVMQLHLKRLQSGEMIIVNCEPGSPMQEKQLVSYVQSYCRETSYFLPEEATAPEVRRLLRPNTLVAGSVNPHKASGRCLRSLIDEHPQPIEGLSYFIVPSR